MSYCNVQGIGDDGAVVVLPAAKVEKRVVTVTLPDDEMEKVKCTEEVWFNQDVN